VERGRYLATAADCMACHTKPDGGKPFAGGYGIASPLGAIYSTNITPSESAGIGRYTEAQFASAVRDGIGGDGTHLYPAMPYASYSGITDEDIHALYAYFKHGVAPVDEVGPQTRLPFPFNLRFGLAGWNLLFLDGKRFKPDPAKSEQLNRGAYLTEALGHCGECHTPRNLFMAQARSRAYAGAPLGSWSTPNITSDPISGIGGWEVEDLVQYLKTGHAAGKGQAAGGMAEAVQNSLQFLPQADLEAIAAFLKATPPIRDANQVSASYAVGKPAYFEARLRGATGPNERGPLTSGEALYSGYCASCHQPSGAGSSTQSYPSLFHNTATGSGRASNLISAILFGVDRQVGDQHVLMPRFDATSFVDPLSDQQIALIANYVLEQFGNPGVKVMAADVAIARMGGPSLSVPPSVLLALAAAGIALVVALAWWGRRRLQTAG
jgi:fructose 5-dehydrogenase cytochrome subunit